MPFPDVDGKNFEQVLNGLIHYIKPPLDTVVSTTGFQGWHFDKYVSAFATMVAASSDRLWTAAIDAQGNSKADELATRLDALELIVSRLDEQVSSLQVRS